MVDMPDSAKGASAGISVEAGQLITLVAGTSLLAPLAHGQGLNFPVRNDGDLRAALASARNGDGITLQTSFPFATGLPLCFTISRSMVAASRRQSAI